MEKAPKASFLGSLNNLVQDIQAGINFRRTSSILAEAPAPAFMYLEGTSMAIHSWISKFQSNEMNLVIKDYLIIQGQREKVFSKMPEKFWITNHVQKEIDAQIN